MPRNTTPTPMPDVRAFFPAPPSPTSPTSEEVERARELFLRAQQSRAIRRRLAAPESPMQGLELLGGAL